MTDASWQADPTGRHELRYWDGTRWTDHVSDQGATGTDPVAGNDRPPEAAPLAAGAAPPPAGWPPASPPGGSPPLSSPSPSSPSPSSPVGDGSNKGPVLIGLVVLAVLGVGAWFLFLKDDDKDSPNASGDTSAESSEDSGSGVDAGAGTTTTSSPLVTPEVPGGLGRDELRQIILDSMLQSGMSEDQANCIVDGLFDQFGDQLEGAADFTEEQTQAITQLTLQCITGG